MNNSDEISTKWERLGNWLNAFSLFLSGMDFWGAVGSSIVLAYDDFHTDRSSQSFWYVVVNTALCWLGAFYNAWFAISGWYFIVRPSCSAGSSWLIDPFKIGTSPWLKRQMDNIKISLVMVVAMAIWGVIGILIMEQDMVETIVTVNARVVAYQYICKTPFFVYCLVKLRAWTA